MNKRLQLAVSASSAASTSWYLSILLAMTITTAIAKPLWPPSWIWAKDHGFTNTANYVNTANNGQYTYLPSPEKQQPQQQQQLQLQLQPSISLEPYNNHPLQTKPQEVLEEEEEQLQLQQQRQLDPEEEFNQMKEQIAKKKKAGMRQLQVQRDQLQGGRGDSILLSAGRTELIPKPLRLIQNYGKLTAMQRMNLQRSLGEQEGAGGHETYEMRKSLGDAIKTAFSQQFMSPAAFGVNTRRQQRSHPARSSPLSLIRNSSGLATFLKAATRPPRSLAGDKRADNKDRKDFEQEEEARAIIRDYLKSSWKL